MIGLRQTHDQCTNTYNFRIIHLQASLATLGRKLATIAVILGLEQFELLFFLIIFVKVWLNKLRLLYLPI